MKLKEEDVRGRCVKLQWLVTTAVHVHQWCGLLDRANDIKSATKSGNLVSLMETIELKPFLL